jgi:hypothetical protein
MVANQYAHGVPLSAASCAMHGGVAQAALTVDQFIRLAARRAGPATPASGFVGLGERSK